MAAEQGDADSQYSIALAYRDGSGVRKDQAEYLKWLREAAANGLPCAVDLLKESE